MPAPRSLARIAPFVFALSLASTASAQDLWEQYEQESTEFVDLQSRCDGGNIEATTTNRICSQAVQAGVRYAETIETLLASDGSDLSADEQAALVDGLLTTRQIVASVMVDLGQCEEALPVLEQLLAHPDIDDRPVLVEASQRWLDNANACIERQQAPSEEFAGLGTTAEPYEPRLAGPVAMIAGGGALLVGGFVWDAAMASERNAFDEELSNCQTSVALCDRARLGEAKDNIEAARVPIATLVGVGAATAVGGAVWYVVERRRGRADDVSVRVRPVRMSDGVQAYYGLRLRVRL